MTYHFIAQVYIHSIDMTLISPFASNPATCSSATTTVTANSHQDPTLVSTTISYMPTGCPPCTFPEGKPVNFTIGKR
jgi:hypothetical protein